MAPRIYPVEGRAPVGQPCDASLDEIRNILCNLFTWVLSAAKQPYPTVLKHEDMDYSGNVSKEQSSNVRKRQNESSQVLYHIGVHSAPIACKNDSIHMSLVSKGNMATIPYTQPAPPLKSPFPRLSNLGLSEQITTIVKHQSAGSLTKPSSSLHFFFGPSILSPMTCRNLVPCNTLQQCAIRLCHQVLKVVPKMHEYSNNDGIHQLSLVCSDLVGRYGPDHTRELDWRTGMKILEKHTLTLQGSHSFHEFNSLDSKYYLQNVITGDVETRMGLQDNCTGNLRSVFSRPEVLVIRGISNYATYNTNNSNMKQCLQGKVDIQKVSDSVYNSILQRCETPTAVQTALTCQNAVVLDRIANTIIIEITRHLQPLLSGEILPKSCASSSAENLVEEVLDDITPPTKSYPLTAKQSKSFIAVYNDAFLEDVISGVLSKIVLTANSINANHEMMPECKISETAIPVVRPLVAEMNKSQLKIITVTKDTKVRVPCESDVTKVVDSICQKVVDSFGSYQAAEKTLTCNSKKFVEKTMGLILNGIIGYHTQPTRSKDPSTPRLYVTLDAKKIVPKIQNDVKKLRQKDRPFSPLTTMLPSKVLDDIVVKLVSQIFPPTTAVDPCAENQSGLSDTEFLDMVSKLTKEVMMEISNHEIWYTQDATYIQCVHSQKDANAVDSVYNNIMDKYGNQMSSKDSKTKGIENSVKRISRLLIREISNPNFMAEQPEAAPGTYSSTSPSCVVEHILCGLDVSWERSRATDPPGVYSASFLQEILSGVTAKLFCIISEDQLKKGKDKEAAEAEFSKMAESFVTSLVTEIDMAQVRVREGQQSCPETSKPVVDLIVTCIFRKISEEYENPEMLYDTMSRGSNVLARRTACLVVSAISYYQLQIPATDHCSFTSLDAKAISAEVVNNAICGGTPGQPSPSAATMVKVPSTTSVQAGSVLETVLCDITQPLILQPEITMLSSTILEEIVTKFLCKLYFNCPKITLCCKDISSTLQVKTVTEKILNALLVSISSTNIKFTQDTSLQRFIHPKDSQVIEKVVEDVYSNVYYLSGSHMSIYENIVEKEDLAQKIACFMVGEISNYQFQPVYPHGKLSDKYVSTQSGYIVQRVLNDVREMPHYSQLLDSNPQVLYAPFLEEIVSQFLTKMFVSSNYFQLSRTRCNSLESELSKIASQLINTVLKEMLKSEINVIKPANEQLCLHPEDEDFIAVVVDAVYMNALRESGSPFKLFKAITSGCTVVSERIAGLVIKELSKFQLQAFPASCVSCDVFTDIEVAKIVEKVFTDVEAQSTLTANVENIVHSITYKITDPNQDEDDRLPVIIPHIKQEPMKVDPATVIEHLAVFSIKTEAIEILEKQSLLQTGQGLAFLRKAAVSGKDAMYEISNAPPLSSEFEVGDVVLSRALLDKLGRINVRPRMLASRNSFFNVLKPDITTVELLQDVKTTQELLIRLVTHNIRHYDDDEGIDEVVISDEICMPVQPSKTSVLIAKISSIANKKRCCGCCGGSSTKTKDSQKKKKEQQQGSVSHLNKNTSASHSERYRENRNCIIDVLHFMNSDPTNEPSPRGLNNNANSLSYLGSFQSDISRRCLTLDSCLNRSSSKTRHGDSANTPTLKPGKPHTLQYHPVSLLLQQGPQSTCMRNEWRLPMMRKDVRCNQITIKPEPETEKYKLPDLPLSTCQPFPQCSCVGNKWPLPEKKKASKHNQVPSRIKPKKGNKKVHLPFSVSVSRATSSSLESSSDLE
ncbi:fibrous sheath-interacting protein 2-like isoform X2 [Ambystoma mexicanum]|uniref:fibrous sheath-interacting protein 2-like isoform X2 n=1 Tax=Ambystoma mexicanum TaxID=8296 RepID=UPI0037E9AD96